VITAREEILARVRRAQSGDGRAVSRAYRPAGTVAVAIDQFIDRLVDYKATVRRCSLEGTAAAIRLILDGTNSIVCPTGFPSAWLDSLPAHRDEPQLTVDELDATHAVLTTCALAIAETGTIILDHGPGQGRRALTLVPDHHVLVVRIDQVVASVPDAVAALTPGSLQTWISGPSATSDIELNRVEGVHGPRRLDVLVAG